MSPTIPEKRRYSREEIGHVIQRATQLHEEHGTGRADDSLSLDEVEHIASELGIPAHHVRAAARELLLPSEPKTGFSLFGAPFSVSYSRVIDKPLDDSQWERVVAELRRFTGARGKTDAIGNTHEWSRTVEDLGTTLYGDFVSARSDGNETSLNLRKNFGGVAVPLYVLGIGLGLAAAGIRVDELDLPTALQISIVGGTGLGALATIRLGLSLWGNRQKDRLRAIADRIQFTISAYSPEGKDGEKSPPDSDRLLWESVQEATSVQEQPEATHTGLLEFPDEEVDTGMPEKPNRNRTQS